jgi:hypothetical protein
MPGIVVPKPRKPLGVLPQRPRVCTQFPRKPCCCNERFVSSFTQRHRYISQMFVYSLLWRIQWKFWQIGYIVRILCHCVVYQLSGLKSTAVGLLGSAKYFEVRSPRIRKFWEHRPPSPLLQQAVHTCRRSFPVTGLCRVPCAVLFESQKSIISFFCHWCHCFVAINTIYIQDVS